MNDLLLDVMEVSKTFARGRLLSREKIVAVNKVSMQLAAGQPEILAIIGESGSGKTTLARMILNMETPTSGRLVLDGTDLAAMGGNAARLAFMHKVQPIFQNPFESFNPLKRVERYLLMTRLRFAGAAGESTAAVAVDAALHKVGLSLKEVGGRYPHELSGGQLQRVAIARALLAEPKLIVADEPVSMIDASLRMSIVNLFRTLRDELGISIIYVTHDLATAYYISDRIMIMQKGSVVESGDARTVLKAPRHPYTRQLREAVLLPEVASAPAIVTPNMNGLSPGAPERRA
ncbi:ATP-binding cassette domain-containing protein [Bradyrhizobium sp. WYCCWR 13023]|uniref:ATP-binding cassette domain-containing protein n=1 Tax=Bradyrhizobium zhengyangense TaxID=2911009 RepID=A0A9X1RFI1_9BRAD|nr:ATP-binding cassette domain-containing protein [Bradyrhizobium zhengyangense]MCG2629215.1 ATP-binding cassette domain-containing protein [Bradyrhizobium zhengyangense]